MFRSVGMSRKQIVSMIFIESLTGGLIGGVVGAIGGILMVSIVPYVMKAIDMSIPIHYSPGSVFTGIIAGTIITLVASISPAIKSSKLNIIEAVKYE